MYRYIFKKVKSIIPKISETEIIALKSGGVSIDREIFKGRIDYRQLYDSSKIKKLDANEKEFIASTENLLELFGEENVYPNKNIHEKLKYLGNNGYLSMIIDKKYNGNRISITAQSKVLSKISSYNPSLGVITMVPNSLGPGELIQHYGTEEQKNFYLPSLSNGTFIPCFGLTGPNNGSDAVGKIDTGVVELIDGKIKIKVTLNKRYITLAPVSNLMGIAFNLTDPNGFLSNKKTGITLALIESEYYPQLEKTYHNPNNSGFPNGTIKGTIYLDPSYIIGGERSIGEGWKMLMECLAVGRGVSLPATANGSSKYITYAILNYIDLRKQFNMKIGNMEAVKEKFVNMFLNTWIIHCSVQFTNHILDSGSTPSVITAIMKQQTTERARTILNNGMDIYAGSAICTGENNFFTKFYNASPVGITVEGSNTLTRGLIIFGQGLNKSHPYIFPIFESIQNDNMNQFRSNFNSMLSEICINYLSLFNIFTSNEIEKRIDRATLKFSLLSNFVALIGGQIKSKQMLSGNMSDILSNIYLCYSILWYHQHFLNDNQKIVKEETVKILLNEIDFKMNLVIENYPLKPVKFLLYPLKNKLLYTNLENKNKLYEFISNNRELNSIFEDDIYYKNTVLEKMKSIKNLKNDSDEYEKLYDTIISVGENKIK
jgi:acyl-CoA dehydrogenase